MCGRCHTWTWTTLNLCVGDAVISGYLPYIGEMRGFVSNNSVVWRKMWDLGGWIVSRFRGTVYPKKYAHGFCFAVLCCGYTLTDFPISIGLTSLALWQSNDCPSASKATLMNMDKYFRWIHYERLHSHNKAKHNETVCIFLGIYCMCLVDILMLLQQQMSKMI